MLWTGAELSGVILAGGESRRMGKDKAFLRVGGRRLIDRVLNAMEAVAGEVIIVTNNPQEYAGLGARLVCDEYPGTGALGGMYTGLLAASLPYSFVVACDMPFLDTELLRYMAGQVQHYDVVMPHLGAPEPAADAKTTARARDLHPLHAIYSRRCLEPIKQALDRGDLRTVAFLSEVNVRFVGRREIDRFDPQRRSFFNANTPAELSRARQLSRTTESHA
ncbi:MAG: putative molybdenum cofactor guanylyltransferase [Anaerolineales bacterium]|nr:putative molybdenum cofactor guanylyltransferase [Anaerolineales bacterium]